MVDVVAVRCGHCWGGDGCCSCCCIVVCVTVMWWMLFVKQIMKKMKYKWNININIKKIKHTCDKPVTVGTGLTGMGTSMVPGTEKCILTHTHNTHTRVPARYIRTHAHHYHHHFNHHHPILSQRWVWGGLYIIFLSSTWQQAPPPPSLETRDGGVYPFWHWLLY